QLLDDDELDEAAFDMLCELRDDAVAQGERERFGSLLATFAARRPELYESNAHYYLSWQLQDALVDHRPDAPPLARPLAAYAGKALDVVSPSLAALAYHGQQQALLEALRIGWPLVRDSDNVMGWAVGDFSEMGAAYEMYDHLERVPVPDPSSSELLDRIRYFV